MVASTKRYRTPCIEDIELGYRLVSGGHAIRLRKTLQVKHLKRWSVASLLHTDFFQRAVPWTELILRERHMPNDLNVQLTQRISMLCVYGLLGTLAAVLARLLVWRRAVALAGLLLAPLLLFNAALYCFFWRRHGGWFALGAVFWHWLYYFYSGIALGVGSLRFLRTRLRGRTQNEGGQRMQEKST